MSHATSAQALLPRVHRKPRLQALLASLVGQFDEATLALTAVQTNLTLDSATGWWLDIIGARVGAKRSRGLSDDAYRRKIRAIIAADRSNGSAGALLAMARALFGRDDGAIAYRSWRSLAAHLNVTETVVDAETRGLVLNLSQRAVSGPTRVLLETGDQEPGQEFAFGNTGWLTSSVGIGEDHPVLVPGVGPHANSGTLVIGAGTSQEETVSYTKYEGLFVFSTTVVHTARSSVEVLSDGAGFGVGGLRRIQDTEQESAIAYASFGALSGASSGSFAGDTGTGRTATLSGSFAVPGGTFAGERGAITIGTLSGSFAAPGGTFSGIAETLGGFLGGFASPGGSFTGTVATPGPTIVDEGPITAASPTIVDEGPITAASPTIVDEGPITAM